MNMNYSAKSVSSIVRVEVAGNPIPITQRPIYWNGPYPYFPSGNNIKHYLYKNEFSSLFPTEMSFNKTFPSRKYQNVRFPCGYE